MRIADLLPALEWNGIKVTLNDAGSGLNVNGLTTDKRLLLEIIHSHCDEIVEHLRANRNRSGADAGAIAEGILRAGDRPRAVPTLCAVCRANLVLNEFAGTRGEIRA